MSLPKTLHQQNNTQFKNDEFEASGTESEVEEFTDNDLLETPNSEGTIHMMYKICNEAGLKETFPALYTALSIALTLPISSVSPERTFSKLKLVKTRLRSTMSEDKLEALLMMSSECDIPIDVDTCRRRDNTAIARYTSPSADDTRTHNTYLPSVYLCYFILVSDLQVSPSPTLVNTTISKIVSTSIFSM